MNAETLARALGGRRVGAAWMARCPAHADRTPSLSIRDADGKVLVYCHAQCDQARVIAALRARGLWPDHEQGPGAASRRRVVRHQHLDDSDLTRTEPALAIWRAAGPTGGTLIERYLASRGIDLPPPPAIRFHPALKHPTCGVWPGMVALVTRGADGVPLAIHRTFLASDGKGKAPVNPERMMLGPCAGGAVRLSPPGNPLMIGEGLETCLAAMQATGHPTWAALTTSGLHTLGLPKDVRNVIVLADGDDPGELAARAAARLWTMEGRFVRIARPPRGLDFNDILAGRAVAMGKGSP